MNRNEALEKVLLAFKRYYNLDQENAKEPFVAEAVFHSHDENYFLSKSAKLFESDSHEYIFFASEEVLTPERLTELDTLAWEEGMNRLDLKEGHKNTDVALIVLADQFDGDIKSCAKKLKHYKSYSFSLKGWSNYRLIAMEVPTGEIANNRLGDSLKKTLLAIK